MWGKRALPFAVAAIALLPGAVGQVVRVEGSLPSARWGMGAVVMEGVVLLVGGEGADGPLGDVLSYAPSARSLTRVASLPEPRAEPGVVAAGGRLFVFGGRGPQGDLDTIVEVDLATGAALPLAANLPTPRHAVAAAFDPTERALDGCPTGCAYLFGGARVDDDRNERLLDVLRFDPSTRTLTTMKARLASAQDLGRAAFDGRDVLLYGQDARLVRYDPREDALSATTLARAPPAGSALAWDGQMAYLVGGEGARVTRHDPATGQLLALPGRVPNATRDAAAAWVAGAVLVFGGRDAAGAPIATIARFDPAAALARPPPAVELGVAVGGLNVTATATATPASGAVARYAWSWGDGAAEDAGAVATHAYAAAGAYVVAVTVVDDEGASSTVTRDVVLLPPPAPPVPDVRISVVGLGVQGDASGSRDPDGRVVNVSWAWGDGNESSGLRAYHAYDAPGPRVIVVTLVDDAGLRASWSREVTLDAPRAAAPPSPTRAPQEKANAPPVARMSLVADGMRVLADASGARDPEGAAVSYHWAWGDGAASFGAVAAHDYTRPGDYDVRLTVMDDRGATTVLVERVAARAPAAPAPDAPEAPPAAPPVVEDPPDAPGARIELGSVRVADADGASTPVAAERREAPAAWGLVPFALAAFMRRRRDARP